MIDGDNNRRNALFITADHTAFLDLAEAMNRGNIYPAVWLPPSIQSFQKKIQTRFPACHILESVTLLKGSCLNERNLSCSDIEFITNQPDFHMLKDQAIKMMDRQDDYMKYRFLDREAVFYSLLIYAVNLIKKNQISVLIAHEGQHFAAHMILYKVCEYLGVKNIHFAPSSVAPFLIMKEGADNNSVKINNITKEKQLLIDKVHSYVDSFDNDNLVEPIYMRQQKQHDRERNQNPFVKFINLNNTQKISFFYKLTKKTVKPVIKPLVQPFRKSKIPSIKYAHQVKSLSFLTEPLAPNESQIRKKKLLIKEIKSLQYNAYKEISKQPDFSADYVFFPLHYEPERTINPDGERYYNSYDTLIALRNIVPDHIPIYVKEHYSQFSYALNGERGRSHYFYKSLSSLPNIKFIDVNTPSRDLILNAQLTIAVTGTAALEAACLEKKSMIMGKVWFEGCPNVYHTKENLTYDTILEKDIASRDEIKLFFAHLIKNYAVTGTNSEKIFMRYYDVYKDTDVLDNHVMVDDIICGLKNIGVIGEN